MSEPWYVDEDGEVFNYRMHSPDTIKLSDGRVINPDNSGTMFATEEAAIKHAEVIKRRLRRNDA
jgi:hypothetical protein